MDDASRRPRHPTARPPGRRGGRAAAGGAGTTQTSAPQVSLIAPANGALLQGNAVTFTWRVDWLQPPPTGTVIVVHRLATDPGFTQMVSTNTQACPAANVNCWTSYKPNASYKGRYYCGLPVLEGRTPFAPVDWRVPQRFYSTHLLSRRLPAGIYKICITAWDKAGNQGRSCARYRIR